MFIGVVIVYNEEAFLADCLLPLQFCDRIIIVDGAIKGFPHKKPYSTDGTLEIAKKFNCEIIRTDKAWEDEIAKRNAYLVGSEGDYYFQVDADEVFCGKLPNLTEEVYQIELRRLDGVAPYPIFRIFKHKKGIHYRGCHNALFSNGELLNKKPMKTLEGCYLEHRTTLRSDERKRDKGIYLRKLWLKERDFREGNNL